MSPGKSANQSAVVSATNPATPRQLFEVLHGLNSLKNK